MKKIRSFLAFVLTVSVFTATACTSQTGESSSAADLQSVSQSQENSDSSSESEADSSQTAKPVTDYTTYVSNTVISTGNNFYIEEAENITYRAYLPVEEYGELEYKFFFTNTVDSTYTKGKIAFVGKSGGSYTVSNATVADGGTGVEDEITNRTPVTFGGETKKDVKPDESYTSDTVTINIP